MNWPLCLHVIAKGAPAAPYGWAASRDKVERNEATILAFRSGQREADHIQWTSRRRANGAGLRFVRSMPFFATWPSPRLIASKLYFILSCGASRVGASPATRWLTFILFLLYLAIGPAEIANKVETVLIKVCA